jgi:hypothetical protein
MFDAGDPRHVAMRDDLLAYKAMLVRTHASDAPDSAPPTERQQKLLRDLGYIQ